MNRNNSSTLKNNNKLFGKEVPTMVEASKKESHLGSFSSALFLNEEDELLLMTELLVHFEADTTNKG